MQVARRPAEIAVARHSIPLPVHVGWLESSVVPLHRFPQRLVPQHNARPSELIAQVWKSPADIPTMSESSPVTWVGIRASLYRLLLLRVSVAPYPQHSALPPEEMAQV